MTHLVSLESSQNRELLNTPQTYLDLKVKTIYFRFADDKSEGWMYVEFFIFNGSLHALTLSWQANQTKCESIDKIDMSYQNFGMPIIKEAIKDIPAGRLLDGLLVEQAIPKNLIPVLSEAIGKKVVKWKFAMKLLFQFNGYSKEWSYSPEWEGIHHRMY